MEVEIEIVFLLRFILLLGKRWGYIFIFFVWCVNKMNMKMCKISYMYICNKYIIEL